MDRRRVTPTEDAKSYKSDDPFNKSSESVESTPLPPLPLPLNSLQKPQILKIPKIRIIPSNYLLSHHPLL